MLDEVHRPNLTFETNFFYELEVKWYIEYELGTVKHYQIIKPLA